MDILSVNSFKAEISMSGFMFNRKPSFKVIIAEKLDEAEWDVKFQRDSEALIAMAKKVKKEVAEGETKLMDCKIFFL
jgi:hypothetical protein